MQIEGELCEGSGVGDGPAQRNPRDNHWIHQRPRLPKGVEFYYNPASPLRPNQDEILYDIS
jgi:hypothetical protein